MLWYNNLELNPEKNIPIFGLQVAKSLSEEMTALFEDGAP
jgi:hypothetical protein